MLRRPNVPVYFVILVVAVFATYANVYGNVFLFDDEFLILRNHFLDSFANLSAIFTSSSTAGAGFTDSFYRPTQQVAYLVVTQIFGREPWAFHALNVGLHAINAGLVFVLARRLQLTARAALIGALTWALHPLHVEAVTYVSATADPLHALFVLGGLCVAIPFTPARVWVASGLAVLGMLSKESAIVFPALLSAVIFAVDQKRWAWRTYLKTWPAWLSAGVYYTLRRTWLHFDDATAFFKGANAYADHALTRLYTALAALPAYAELLVWPHDLHMDREFLVATSFVNVPTLLGAVMVAAGVSVVVRARRWPTPARLFAAFVTLWLTAAHLPHSGILIAVNSVFLEHWMYLTSVPLFLALGSTLAPVRFGIGVGVVIALALAQKTFRQNRVWATPVQFFSHTLAYSPTSARIRHNLAIALADQGRDDEALEQYELMIRAGTTYPQTFHNAALTYLKRRDLDRAEPYFLRALELDPKFYPSAQYLSILYATRGNRAQSERYLELYRRLAP